MKCDEGVMMPRRADPGSAGYDFYAPCDIELRPGEDVEVDSGVRLDGTERPCIELSRPLPAMGPGFGTVATYEPSTWVLQLYPRSGLGFKYGTRFTNTVGIIDMSYRDNIRAKLTCDRPVTIKKGERYMQGVFMPFCVLKDEVECISQTRKGGLGSSGD